MAALLEYGLSSVGMKTDDSIISSSCSSIEAADNDMDELFSFHLNFDGSFGLSSREFYDNVSSASTPSVARSSDILQRNGYDTDDSGFCENFVFDSELLQMSSLHLGDESLYESTTGSRRSDTFPLPKMCLLSQFEEYCENEVENTSSVFQEQCEVTRKSVDVVSRAIIEQRVSTRRQRSPEAVVERCSRHRLSLDSFSESGSDDSKPIRRSFDSFVPAHTPDEIFTDLPPPVLVTPSQDNAVLEPSLAAERLFNPPLDEDRIFGPSPVADVDIVLKEGLKCILAEFAPPCLEQLIGRKMGLHHVDIISELHDRSMTIIVRHICSYLTDTDLRSLLLVSVGWSCIIASDRQLMSRIKSLNSRHRPITKLHSKENAVRSKISTRSIVTRSLTSSTAPVDVLQPLTSVATLTNQPAKSVSVVKKTAISSVSRHAAQFWKEAEKLYSGEKLTKCPRCCGPSRIDPAQERGRCVSLSCQFDFCQLCLLAYHSTRRCRTALPIASTKSTVSTGAATPGIGSRKSRRQLRRL